MVPLKKHFRSFWYLVHFAGRGAKEANLYTEIAEGIHSYGITRHRHGKVLLTLPYIYHALLDQMVPLGWLLM